MTPLLFSNLVKSKCSYIHVNVSTGTKIKTVFVYNKVLLMNVGNRTTRQLEKKLISGVSTGTI